LKIYFKLLEKTDIAVLDSHTGSIFSSLLDKYTISFIDIRKESIHFFPLIKAIGKYLLSFLKEELSYLYLIEVIKTIKPKICLSAQDANTVFYKLDKYFKDINFTTCQQGLKDDYCIDHFSDISGDYFAFGDAYKKLLNNNLTKIQIIGSLKSNMNILDRNKIKRICYISGFSGHPINSAVFRNVNYAEFAYVPHYCGLSILNNFCINNNIDLVIASKSYREPSKEKREKVFQSEYRLFRNILGEEPKLIKSNAYETAGNSELSVCDHSSLGYELIGRDCKVVFLNLVSYFHNEKSYKFGWPQKYDDKGAFWTNIYDTQYINQMLTNIWEMNKDEYEKLILPYKSVLMYYDKNNTKLIKHIESIISN